MKSGMLSNLRAGSLAVLRRVCLKGKINLQVDEKVFKVVIVPSWGPLAHNPAQVGLKSGCLCSSTTIPMNDSLPPELTQGAILRDKEYAWELSDFPQALHRAPALGYACLGGQFWFLVSDVSLYEPF
jgi:hypothetical protein